MFIKSNPIVCINTSMDFQKLIYENVEKKNILQQACLYIWVTDILNCYEILFCTYCKGMFLFVFMKQSLHLHSSVYA